MKALQAKVTGTGKPFETNEKRLYMSGVKLTAVCPKCGQKVVEDFGDNYLSYPTANKEFEYTLYCRGEHESTVKLKLNITLEVVGGAS